MQNMMIDEHGLSDIDYGWFFVIMPIILVIIYVKRIISELEALKSTPTPSLRWFFKRSLVAAREKEIHVKTFSSLINSLGSW